MGIAVLTRIAFAEVDKPEVGRFLEFLATDISVNPQQLNAVDTAHAQRIGALVDGVKVDLDAQLSADDE